MNTKAIFVMTASSLRKCHGVTVWPSRRKAISYNIVARELVTERFGAKSAQINAAFFTIFGTCANCITLAAIKPAGRLFIRLQDIVILNPLPQTVPATECAALLQPPEWALWEL